MKKLTEIYNSLSKKVQRNYKKYNYIPKNWADENLFENYILLGELLDPNNSYEYTKINRNTYGYIDASGNNFYVKITYQPTQEPYMEVKAYWIDLKTNKPVYDKLPNVTAKDWDKRSNTVAKIYQDEIIPFFKSQDLTDLMVFLPLDPKRYQLSIRMVKKFNKDNFEIIEDFPNKITIVK
jgi:hypothetical protein